MPSWSRRTEDVPLQCTGPRHAMQLRGSHFSRARRLSLRASQFSPKLLLFQLVLLDTLFLSYRYDLSQRLAFETLFWFSKLETDRLYPGNLHFIGISLTLSREVLVKSVFRSFGILEPTAGNTHRDRSFSMSWNRLSRKVSFHEERLVHNKTVEVTHQHKSVLLTETGNDPWQSIWNGTLTPTVRHGVRFTRQRVTRPLSWHCYPPGRKRRYFSRRGLLYLKSSLQ